jgi:hypothetical protein
MDIFCRAVFVPCAFSGRLDEVANVETFTHRVFPEWISVEQLGIIRLSFAAIIWLTTFYGICSTGNPLVPSYVKGTRLKPAMIQMNGIKTLGPFTSWAWIILGAAFSSSGTVCLLADADQSVPVALVRTAAICWETAAPFTILVSAAIKYAIWPLILKQGGKTESLKKPRAVLQHNANVLMAIAEVALLGGLPVRWSYISFGPLIGCTYILFTWSMACHWVDVTKSGPQFIYFFMDTTLPGHLPTYAIVGLLGVLLLSFGIFSSATSFLGMLPGSFVAHVLFAVGVCLATMRLRD